MAQKNYQKLGLYIHIPFCKHKCAYCDFYSCDNYRMKGTHSTPEMKAFVGALTNHMIIVSDRTTEYDIDSVFIGGGSILLHTFLEQSPQVAKASFVESPNANAIGYEMLARKQLTLHSVK